MKSIFQKMRFPQISLHSSSTGRKRNSPTKSCIKSISLSCAAATFSFLSTPSIRSRQAIIKRRRSRRFRQISKNYSTLTVSSRKRTTCSTKIAIKLASKITETYRTGGRPLSLPNSLQKRTQSRPTSAGSFFCKRPQSTRAAPKATQMLK